MEIVLSKEIEIIRKEFLGNKSSLSLVAILDKTVKRFTSEKCAAILKEKIGLDLQPIDHWQENPKRIPRILRDPLETMTSAIILRELRKDPNVMANGKRIEIECETMRN